MPESLGLRQFSLLVEDITCSSSRLVKSRPPGEITIS